MLLHTVGWQPMKVIGGRFTLLGRLAFGGMAEVWLARQTGPQGFSRMVVVKRVLEARCSEPEILSMFVEEARLGGQLAHPNIVQTVDFGEDDGVPFIVLEYLFGETLAQVLKTARQRATPVPIPLAVHIISEASLGLSSAHELKGLDGKPLGIVHRDVSPQNVLITYDGMVKVLDFGIAKSAERESHTDQTHVRGRVTYMAPEQMTSSALDQRADVFSLGVVLWEAVTDQPMHPLNQQADAIVMAKLLSSDAPLPSAHKANPQVPEELDLILGRALQKDRERRYATSALFRGALQAFLRKQTEPPSSAQLSQLMATLFADRQQERTQVLQRLSTGATPKWTPSVVDALAPPMATATDPRIDAQKGVETSESPVQRRGRVMRWGAVAAVLAGVMLGLGAVWFFARGGPPKVTTVAAAPVVAVTVEPPQALSPAPAPEPAPAPTPTPAPEPALAPAPEVAEAAQPPPAQARAAPPSKPKGGAGKLRLDTEPWTTVFYKGKKLGDTPLIDVRVPSGQVELLLVNEEAKIHTVIDVEVTAGETTTKRLHF